jgi:hypothetical protein
MSKSIVIMRTDPGHPPYPVGTAATMVEAARTIADLRRKGGWSISPLAGYPAPPRFDVVEVEEFQPKPPEVWEETWSSDHDDEEYGGRRYLSSTEDPDGYRFAKFDVYTARDEARWRMAAQAPRMARELRKLVIAPDWAESSTKEVKALLREVGMEDL